MLLLHPGSTGGSTAAQAGNTTRCRDLFAAKKLSYLEVDGSNPTEKEVRDKLFGISGVRGNYPQIFKCKGGDIECAEFIGCWDKIEELNELNELPAEVMEAHPEIVTLDNLLSDVEKF
ncbi:hypothetical protein TrCOL_g8478 [Triparma columacea]|uniref:Uncharacterized protein n=1 Tax=Triparma columacea TaxID=722753 RepID=A0A9W7L5E8_9STRA|nr:hypothetical protein TrCOL_g8478 [Triparma columacea]